MIKRGIYRINQFENGKDEDDVLVGSAAPQPKAAAERRDWIAGLCGAQVAYQNYVQHTGSTYTFYLIRCTYHAQPCIKTKGIGGKLEANLGRAGPLAFLHAWLDMEAPPERTHASQNPTLAMARTFHEAHKPELEALCDRLGGD